MNRVAFVTTCKGRLHHLQQTLPRFVAEQPDELIVVDYGCPQGTATWVHENFPDAEVVRVEDDPGFSLSRARNFGAAAATADWICFLDADSVVAPGWVRWMRDALRPGCFFRVAPASGVRQAELWGTFIVEGDAFRRCGGYDELLRGWGGEDADLYRRLQRSGLREADFPGEFVSTIAHGDDERLTYSQFPDRARQLSANVLYLSAKHASMVLASVTDELPLAERRRISQVVQSAVSGWADGAHASSLVIRLDVQEFGDWLPAIYRHRARCTLTLTVEAQPVRRDGLLKYLSYRVRRDVRKAVARVLGIPLRGLDAIDSQIVSAVRRRLADTSEAFPHALMLSAEGDGARLPSPLHLWVCCEFSLLPAQA